MTGSRHEELLDAVREATAAIEAAQARQLEAIRAARSERVPVEAIAQAAGFSGRDGVNKLLRRSA